MLDLTEDDGTGQRFASPAAWCLLVALALALLVAWGYRVDNTSLRRELGEARQEAIAATCKAQETLVGKASLIGGKVYIRPDGKVPVTDGRCCCGDFPGAAWYCLQGWAVEEGDLIPVGTCCRNILTAEAWAAYLFDTLQAPFVDCALTGWSEGMWTTDSVKHASAEACGENCP